MYSSVSSISLPRRILLFLLFVLIRNQNNAQINTITPIPLAFPFPSHFTFPISRIAVSRFCSAFS
jgi:hypothetical protein